MLIVSALVGIYFAYQSRRKTENVNDYLMAGRSMHFFPTSLSIMCTALSAITILGKFWALKKVIQKIRNPGWVLQLRLNVHLVNCGIFHGHFFFERNLHPCLLQTWNQHDIWVPRAEIRPKSTKRDYDYVYGGECDFNRGRYLRSCHRDFSCHRKVTVLPCQCKHVPK